MLLLLLLLLLLLVVVVLPYIGEVKSSLGVANSSPGRWDRAKKNQQLVELQTSKCVKNACADELQARLACAHAFCMAHPAAVTIRWRVPVILH